jgi:hypothetical protein
MAEIEIINYLSIHSFTQGREFNVVAAAHYIVHKCGLWNQHIMALQMHLQYMNVYYDKNTENSHQSDLSVCATIL